MTAHGVVDQRLVDLAGGDQRGQVLGVGLRLHVQVVSRRQRQPRRLANHRGNLLNPIWTHVGIGIARDPNGTLFMTQNFVTALA